MIIPTKVLLDAIDLNVVTLEDLISVSTVIQSLLHTRENQKDGMELVKAVTSTLDGITYASTYINEYETELITRKCAYAYYLYNMLSAGATLEDINVQLKDIIENIEEVTDTTSPINIGTIITDVLDTMDKKFKYFNYYVLNVADFSINQVYCQHRKHAYVINMHDSVQSPNKVTFSINFFAYHTLDDAYYNIAKAFGEVAYILHKGAEGKELKLDSTMTSKRFSELFAAYLLKDTAYTKYLSKGLLLQLNTKPQVVTDLKWILSN